MNVPKRQARTKVPKATATTLSTLAHTVATNSKRIGIIESELKTLVSIRDDWFLFRQEMAAQMSSLRDWLQGWVLRNDINVRALKEGHEHMTAVLLRVESAVMRPEGEP